METGDKFLNFDLIKNWRRKKDHIKISRFTKFGVVSLDFNHVEIFQKSEKISFYNNCQNSRALIG